MDSGAARYTYAEVARAARGFAARLHALGLRKGDKVVFWSENRPEWIVAFWGCLLAGIVVVPIDYRASPDFLARVAASSRRSSCWSARTSRRSTGSAGRGNSRRPVWQLHDLDWRDGHAAARADRTRRRRGDHLHVGRDRRAQGRRHHAPQRPREHRPGRARGPEVPEVGDGRSPRMRFLNLLPLSHMFGQAMATFIPPMLPGTVVFMRGYNPVEIVAQIKKRRDLGARVGARRSSTSCASTCSAWRLRPGGRPAAADGRHFAPPLVALPRGPPAVRLEVLGLRRRRRAARRRARGVLVRARLRRRPGLRPHRDRADRHAEPSVRHARRDRSARRSPASR